MIKIEIIEARDDRRQLLNWGEWTPTDLERYEMFEAAEKEAIKEAKEALL